MDTKEIKRIIPKKNCLLNRHLYVGHEKHYWRKGAGSRSKPDTFVWDMKSTIGRKVPVLDLKTGTFV